MSFFDKLQKRTAKYFNGLVEDPEEDAKEKKRLKRLKAAVADANKKIKEEKDLLKKAQKTRGPGSAEQAISYSIFPEDGKEYQAYLDEASKTVAAATEAEEVVDYMKDRFGESFEIYKINCIFNTIVYAKAQGGRIGPWLIIRAVKQLRRDNRKLNASELSLLKTIIEDFRKILDDTKFMKPQDWEPIATEELKNLDNYKKIFQTQADKIDKNSEEYKNLIGLFPKLFEAVQKLIKNRGELDFDDTMLQETMDNSSTGDSKDSKDSKGGAGAAAASTDDDCADDTCSKSDPQGGILNKTLNYTLGVFYYLTLLLLSVLGVSLATNLNVHREIPYRILYMVYGFIFGRIVVPYVLLYRWAYLGKKPHYFSFIPLIDRPFVNPTVQNLLSWLTYIPDKEKIDMLRKG
jgi:hypothetical protein